MLDPLTLLTNRMERYLLPLYPLFSLLVVAHQRPPPWMDDPRSLERRRLIIWAGQDAHLPSATSVSPAHQACVTLLVVHAPSRPARLPGRSSSP